MRAARAPRTPRARAAGGRALGGGGRGEGGRGGGGRRGRARADGDSAQLWEGEGDVRATRTPPSSAAAPRWREQRGRRARAIQMAAKLGTGLNVRAATPTLVALQERKAAEAAEEAALERGEAEEQAAAPKVIGAMAPARGPAGPSAEAEAEVGAAVAAGVGDIMVGPPMPPPGAGADDDAFVGPPMPPSGAADAAGAGRRAAAAARGGGRRRLRPGRPQPAGDAERRRRRRRRRGRRRQRRRRRRRAGGASAGVAPDGAEGALEVRDGAGARPGGVAACDGRRRLRPVPVGLCGDDARAQAVPPRRGAAGRLPAAEHRLLAGRRSHHRLRRLEPAGDLRPRWTEARDADEGRHVHPPNGQDARPRRRVHPGALARPRQGDGDDGVGGRHGAALGRAGGDRPR